MALEYMSLLLVTAVLLCLMPKEVHPGCTGAYGEHCSYTPSPPGESPKCAEPGMTFCEYPTHYPSQLVHHLLEQWVFDHDSLLKDEAKYDLNYYTPATKYTYGPPQNNIHYPENAGGYSRHNNFQGYNYTPQQNRTNYYADPPGYHKHHSKTPYAEGGYQSPYHQYYNKPGYQGGYQQQPWRKWNTQKYLSRRRRDLIRFRSKRQDFTTVMTLCASRLRYVYPRAGLNDKGNWMFIVNMPEMNDQKFTQLVSSETCRSEQCSDLCNLPLDYSAKCEQKYIQKRLMALEPNGTKIYTDLFWFPSCCVCQITRS